MPCHTIPYDSHTLPYHTIPCHAIPYDTMPYHTIPYPTIPYHTISYHTMPYHTIVIRTHDEPQNHAFPYVSTPYLVLNTIIMVYYLRTTVWSPVIGRAWSSMSLCTSITVCARVVQLLTIDCRSDTSILLYPLSQQPWLPGLNHRVADSVTVGYVSTLSSSQVPTGLQQYY